MLQLSGLVYKIPVYPALPPRYLFWAYVIWEAVSQAAVLSVSTKYYIILNFYVVHFFFIQH